MELIIIVQRDEGDEAMPIMPTVEEIRLSIR